MLNSSVLQVVDDPKDVDLYVDTALKLSFMVGLVQVGGSLLQY
jgi:hypothetical protein